MSKKKKKTKRKETKKNECRFSRFPSSPCSVFFFRNKKERLTGLLDSVCTNACLSVLTSGSSSMVAFLIGKRKRERELLSPLTRRFVSPSITGRQAIDGKIEQLRTALPLPLLFPLSLNVREPVENTSVGRRQHTRLLPLHLPLSEGEKEARYFFFFSEEVTKNKKKK